MDKKTTHNLKAVQSARCRGFTLRALQVATGRNAPKEPRTAVTTCEKLEQQTVSPQNTCLANAVFFLSIYLETNSNEKA